MFDACNKGALFAGDHESLKKNASREEQWGDVCPDDENFMEEYGLFDEQEYADYDDGDDDEDDDDDDDEIDDDYDTYDNDEDFESDFDDDDYLDDNEEEFM